MDSAAAGAFGIFGVIAVLFVIVLGLLWCVVPFLIMGKLRKCKTVFVESITRVEELSLSARMLWKAGAIDVLVVQHRELGAKYPEAIVVD